MGGGQIIMIYTPAMGLGARFFFFVKKTHTFLVNQFEKFSPKLVKVRAVNASLKEEMFLTKYKKDCNIIFLQYPS